MHYACVNSPPIEAENIEIGEWRHGRSGVPLPSPASPPECGLMPDDSVDGLYYANSFDPRQEPAQAGHKWQS